MPVLDSHLYRDPETVLAGKQQAELRRRAARDLKLQQCGPCTHCVTKDFKNGSGKVCELRQPYGTRCHHFEEKKP